MRLDRKLLQEAVPALKFVPPSKTVSRADIQQLQEFVLGAKRLLVLTGAGLSTESGIPDYRSEGVGLYARTERYLKALSVLQDVKLCERGATCTCHSAMLFLCFRRPIQFQVFMKSHQARQIYWARNFVGWPQFSSFQPNASHRFAQIFAASWPSDEESSSFH